MGRDWVRDEYEDIKAMNYSEAVAYCKGLGVGARLATRAELERLIASMINTEGTYQAQILPGLSLGWFWGDLDVPDEDNEERVNLFYGSGGEIRHSYVDYYIYNSVRCVVPLKGPVE